MKNTTRLVLLLVFTLFGSAVWVTAADPGTSDYGKDSLAIRAQQIILPEFKLDGVTLKAAMIALQEAGRRFDADHHGVNFLLALDPEAKTSPVIKLDLKHVTLAEAADQVARSAGLFVTAKDFALVFSPKTDLGAVEFVAGKPAQFSLGDGKYCKIVGTQLPDAIHLKLMILSTNAVAGEYIIQSLREITTLPGKPCDISLGDKMIRIVPTLKTRER